MFIKTYFSATVEAALSLARRELGEEAMLLNSRLAPDEARHLGRYEVVFAVNQAAPPSRYPDTASAQAGLEAAGIQPDFAREIVHEARPYLSDANLQTQIERRIQVDSRLAPCIALVGPAGRGKTTTILKLAVAQASLGTAVRVYSLGGRPLETPPRSRIATKSFSSPQALAKALDKPQAGLTLIDTPGFHARTMDEAAELSACLHAVPVEIDVHLVLRADSQFSSLQASLRQFAPFSPSKLVFTGLDEAGSLGPAISAAITAAKPVSFLSSGCRIPEDLDAATAKRLAAVISAGDTAIAQAA